MILDLVRYAINDAAVDWSAAESQVVSGRGSGNLKSTIVSVKGHLTAGNKRKQEDGGKKPARRRKRPRANS
jgi:N-acetyltransferase 10